MLMFILGPHLVVLRVMYSQFSAQGVMGCFLLTDK